MTKVLALIWLVLTLAPIALMFYFMGSMLTMSSGTQSFEDAKSQFDFMFQLVMFINLGSLALVISYIAYLFATNHVPSGKRALWAVVLFLGNVFAMPFFWYFYVWRPLQSEGAGA